MRTGEPGRGPPDARFGAGDGGSVAEVNGGSVTRVEGRGAEGRSDGPPQASALQRLRELLLQEGGLMASLLDPAAVARRGSPATRDSAQPDVRDTAGPAAEGPAGLAAEGLAEGPAQLAAAGPRARGRREDYELLMEAIYEGYLLHYHTPRIVCPVEADLGLLAGDRLYALGLDRLVELGDMEAVAELADVITLSALAHGADEQELAHAVWAAGARAVGWGSSEVHTRAKALTRARRPEALDALRLAAAP